MHSKKQSSVKPSEDERLKAAIAGEYQFSIEQCIDEAWVKLKGYKRYFWGANLIIGLISFIVNILSSLILMYVVPVFSQILGILFIIPNYILSFSALLLGLPPPSAESYLGLFAQFLLLPLYAGIFMMSIHYVSAKPIRMSMIFNYYYKPVRYVFAYLWIIAVILFSQIFLFYVADYYALDEGLYKGFGVLTYYVAIPLFIIICLYILISYYFTSALLADRKLKTWQALEASRSAISADFFHIALFMLIMFLALILPGIAIALLAWMIHVAALILGIVYIWIAPFYLLGSAILYREIFGLSTK